MAIQDQGLYLGEVSAPAAGATGFMTNSAGSVLGGGATTPENLFDLEEGYLAADASGASRDVTIGGNTYRAANVNEQRANFWDPAGIAVRFEVSEDFATATSAVALPIALLSISVNVLQTVAPLVFMPACPVVNPASGDDCLGFTAAQLTEGTVIWARLVSPELVANPTVDVRTYRYLGLGVHNANDYLTRGFTAGKFKAWLVGDVINPRQGNSPVAHTSFIAR